LSSTTLLQRESFERLEQVRPSSRPPGDGQALAPNSTEHLSLRALRRNTERDYLIRLLGRYGGDLDRACQHAGIHRKSLERLIRQYGLTRR
jgi:DNA-binding NtrC family response regulator